MRKVIVKTEVSSLGVYERQAVIVVRGIAKGLLHSENWLEPAKCCVSAAKLLQPVIRLEPIALCEWCTRELRTESESRIDWLPPKVHTLEVFMNCTEGASIGCTDFDA